MNYDLVAQEDFTQEQKQHIDELDNLYRMHFPIHEAGFGVKDINSRNISVSEYFTKFIGLSRPEDITGLFDSEIPCKVADFAQDFVDEEKELLSHRDANIKKSMLNILEYSTGLESFISYKQPIVHQPSQSIIGIFGIAHKIDLTSFFTLIPNYFLEFGVQGNLENVQGALKVKDIHLTSYEHEVCFLVTMNLSYKQIASFMNRYRPIATQRTADTIYKCRDRICEKFDCAGSHFREALIGMNLHKKIPNSFLNRMIGNRSLS